MPSNLSDIGRFFSNDRMVLGVLALITGCLVGVGVVAFREGIALVQTVFYGGGEEYLASLARGLPFWQVLLAPTVGGLVVGLYYRYLCRSQGPGGIFPQGVGHVIEAAALKGGRMPLRTGLEVACGTVLSLGCGASVGREGPAVHLGGTLSSILTTRLNLSPQMGRTLLGCGAAAAVAASFNAPIAGALFATEVIVGHYALSAFAPVVVASVAGTLISRGHFGDYPAFQIPAMHLESLWEFPAFVGLGVATAIAALLFMEAVLRSEPVAAWVSKKTKLPAMFRPALAGFLLGILAIGWPELLGVGYEATDEALKNAYGLSFLLVLIPLKILATAMCLGFGFGGGVFSPALTLGALVGAAYGIVATWFFPDLSSGSGAYALIGMGATAAAVMGAPISTTLIVFELTGDYGLTIAVMVSVVVASTLCTQVTGHTSLFHRQLAARGLDLDGAPDKAVLGGSPVRDLPLMPCPTLPETAGAAAILKAFSDTAIPQLAVLDDQGGVVGILPVSQVDFEALALQERSGDDDSGPPEITAGSLCRAVGPLLILDDGQDTAFAAMDDNEEDRLVVVEDKDSRRPLGTVLHVDILRAYADALSRTQSATER
ncbi:MAG: chloride channel protein [Rhodospirillaceae bacterium]